MENGGRIPRSTRCWPAQSSSRCRCGCGSGVSPSVRSSSSKVRPGGGSSVRSRSTPTSKRPNGSAPHSNRRGTTILRPSATPSPSTRRSPPSIRSRFGVLARFPGARTAKVKVAERGQDLAQDLARVRAVREHVPHVRVDANGGWSVEEAVTALTALTTDAPLEYAEQPCASVPELVDVRRRLPGIRIAADESIRRAEDPLRVVRAGGADVAIVKVAPLGGIRRLLTLAEELAEHDVPVVVSSALDSAVGMGAGLAAAAALPDLLCVRARHGWFLHRGCGDGT